LAQRANRKTGTETHGNGQENPKGTILGVDFREGPMKKGGAVAPVSSGDTGRKFYGSLTREPNGSWVERRIRLPIRDRVPAMATKHFGFGTNQKRAGVFHFLTTKPGGPGEAKPSGGGSG